MLSLEYQHDKPHVTLIVTMVYVKQTVIKRDNNDDGYENDSDNYGSYFMIIIIFIAIPSEKLQ